MVKTQLLAMTLIFLGFLSSTHAADYKQKLTGVGLVLSEAPNAVKVDALIPGAPAARSGIIHEGDLILAVQSSPSLPWVFTAQQTLENVVAAIRGPVGVPVGLSIQSADGTIEEYYIVRDEFEVEE